MSEPLMTVTLRGGVGGALTAVVGRLAGPVEPRDGFAILPGRYRDRGQQLRVGCVQQPRQRESMEGERTHPEPALPARGRGIQWCKHRKRPRVKPVGTTSGVEPPRNVRL